MKNKSVFSCQSCGAESPKWQGQCSSCGEWNSMLEVFLSDSKFSAAEQAVAMIRGKKSSSSGSNKRDSHYAGQTGVARFSEIVGRDQQARFSS